MTKEQIQDEIDSLTATLDRLKHDMILTDGAIQAFRYILRKLDLPPQAADAEPEVLNG